MSLPARFKVLEKGGGGKELSDADSFAVPTHASMAPHHLSGWKLTEAGQARTRGPGCLANVLEMLYVLRFMFYARGAAAPVPTPPH